MEVCCGSGGITPRILDLGTRWRWVVSFTPRPLYPQGKNPWYPLDRRLGGPRSQSGRASAVHKLTLECTQYIWNYESGDTQPCPSSCDASGRIRTWLHWLLAMATHGIKLPVIFMWRISLVTSCRYVVKLHHSNVARQHFDHILNQFNPFQILTPITCSRPVSMLFYQDVFFPVPLKSTLHAHTVFPPHPC
jgi:hypothetical protein